MRGRSLVRVRSLPSAHAFVRSIMHTSLASRVTQAYVGLFSVRQSNNGSRTVSFARFGNYDVRLVELLTIGSPIEPSLWIELYHHGFGVAIDSCGCTDLDDALYSAEYLALEASR